MKQKLAAITIILCSIHVFGLYYSAGKSVYFAIDFLGFALIGWSLVFNKKSTQAIPNHFGKPLTYLFLALFISTLSCFIFHDQSILATIIAMRYIFYLAVYFQLRKLNIEKQWIEKMILIGAAIYMVVFFIQVAIFPLKIVDTGRIEEADRGFLRFRIEGAGFLMLAAFMSLNRFLLNKNRQSLLFYIICMVALVMLGFRTLLLTGVIASVFLALKISSDRVKVIRNTFLSLLFILALYLVPFINTYVNDLVELTQSQTDMGDDYVRYQTYNFYRYKVNKDELTLLFGNGFPQDDSRYGKMVSRGVDRGYIYADLGMIGFYLIYGLLAFVAFLYFVIKAVLIKLPKNSQYLNVYFFYMLISSLTTVELYRIGILGIEALALVLIELSLSKKNNSTGLSAQLRSVHHLPVIQTASSDQKPSHSVFITT